MAEALSGQDLDAWLAPFRGAMGRRTRRHRALSCLRGLLGPGDREGLQPRAARLGLPGHDQLQPFIASPAWDDGPLPAELAYPSGCGGLAAPYRPVSASRAPESPSGAPEDER